jgi:hypothetical protein
MPRTGSLRPAIPAVLCPAVVWCAGAPLVPAASNRPPVTSVRSILRRWSTSAAAAAMHRRHPLRLSRCRVASASSASVLFPGSSGSLSDVGLAAGCSVLLFRCRAGPRSLLFPAVTVAVGFPCACSARPSRGALTAATRPCFPRPRAATRGAAGGRRLARSSHRAALAAAFALLVRKGSAAARLGGSALPLPSRAGPSSPCLAGARLPYASPVPSPARRLVAAPRRQRRVRRLRRQARPALVARDWFFFRWRRGARVGGRRCTGTRVRPGAGEDGQRTLVSVSRQSGSAGADRSALAAIRLQ